MLRTFIFLCAGWLMTCVASPAAELREDTVRLQEIPQNASFLLGPRVLFWKNQGSNVPLEEVFAGTHDALFQASSSEYPAPGYLHGELWLKFRIQNEGDQSQILVLESRYPLTDFIEVFQKDPNGSYRSQTQGDKSLHPRNLSNYRSPVFELQVNPGDNTYYLRTETRGPNLLALYLWQPSAFTGHRFVDTLVLGLLFGTLGALFLYNLFLAVSFRSRTYTYYSFFVLSMILTQIAMQNLWPYAVSQKTADWLENEGYLMSVCLSFIAGLLVTMSFLNMKRYMPRIRRFVQILLVLSIALFFMGLVAPYEVFARSMSAFLAIYSLSLIVISVIAVSRGYRPAQYYLCSWLFILGANILVVLSNTGLFTFNLVMQYGNLPGAVLEGILMSFAIGDRVNFIRAAADRKIRELNLELQTHLLQVEALVEERTETIRTILDNVASGFIMVNQEGRIVGGFSRSCHALLGQVVKADQAFVQLLQLSPAEEKFWQMAWRQVFEETLPLDVALAQLPSAISLGQRSLKVEAAALRGNEGSISHILFTIQDVSELKRKQRESRRNRDLIRILRDLEAFRQFINHSYETVQRLRVSTDSREKAFLLHTLKGNSLVFRLKAVAAYLHRLEAKPSITGEDIAAIEKLFSNFLTAHASILRTAWGTSAVEPRLSDVHLESLKALAARRQDPDLQHEVDEWIQNVLARPVSSLVRPMLDSCRMTARKLGKPIRFELLGADALIRSRQEEKVLEFLIHIIRNAVVHGIEMDRKTIGKPAEGLIRIECRETAQALTVICSDDGQGFDRQHWERIAAQRGQVSLDQASSLSLTDLVEQATRGGYSTQQSVSLVAGRGVGLEGLLQTVREVGGSMRIDSERGQGSLFHIVLPREDSATLPQAS